MNCKKTVLETLAFYQNDCDPFLSSFETKEAVLETGILEFFPNSSFLVESSSLDSNMNFEVLGKDN